MVRAFSTLGCPETDLRTAIAFAEKYALEAIELRALGGTINLPSYFASEFGTPDGLGVALRKGRVRVAALDTSLHLAEAKPSDREQFLTFLPWAEAAEVRWLRVFDGGGKMSERKAIAGAAETVAWWRDVRAANGFAADIMVETHNRLFTAATIKRFLKAAPETAILWDAHHTWKQGGEDPLVTWRAIRDHVVHIHVKDSVSIPTTTHPYKYVVPGAGEFPMSALRKALVTDKFAGVVSLEWEKLWHPSIPSVDEALRVATECGWW